MKVKNKYSEPSQRKCCEGKKNRTFTLIKKFRGRNIYSVFNMNVRCFFLPSQCFAVKFHVKNVGLTGLTETTWSHVNLTIYIYRDNQIQPSKMLKSCNIV